MARPPAILPRRQPAVPPAAGEARPAEVRSASGGKHRLPPRALSTLSSLPGPWGYTMRKMILSAMVMAVLGAAGPALAQSNCLPRAVLQSQARVYGPTLELGLVDGSVTLCA